MAVDFGGTIPPDMALQMAKYYGIKVYTLAVGSEKEIDEVVDYALRTCGADIKPCSITRHC
jgi:Ca-activated chloride channel family protein